MIKLLLRRPSAVPAVGGALRGALEMALVLSAASSGVMGIAVAVVELKRGEQQQKQSAET